MDQVPAMTLDHVGIIGPRTIPCVAVRWQIAQKLHACTETFADRENDRFRDLLDLQLLATLVGEGQWHQVRVACQEVFAGRAKQAWPPVLTVPASWSAGYRALAEESQFHVLDASEAADVVREMIDRIGRS
jgi:hypothetical protein